MIVSPKRGGTAIKDGEMEKGGLCATAATTVKKMRRDEVNNHQGERVSRRSRVRARARTATMQWQGEEQNKRARVDGLWGDIHKRVRSTKLVVLAGGGPLASTQAQAGTGWNRHRSGPPGHPYLHSSTQRQTDRTRSEPLVGRRLSLLHPHHPLYAVVACMLRPVTPLAPLPRPPFLPRLLLSLLRCLVSARASFCHPAEACTRSLAWPGLRSQCSPTPNQPHPGAQSVRC